MVDRLFREEERPDRHVAPHRARRQRTDPWVGEARAGGIGRVDELEADRRTGDHVSQTVERLGDQRDRLVEEGEGGRSHEPDADRVGTDADVDGWRDLVGRREGIRRRHHVGRTDAEHGVAERVRHRHPQDERFGAGLDRHPERHHEGIGDGREWDHRVDDDCGARRSGEQHPHICEVHDRRGKGVRESGPEGEVSSVGHEPGQLTTATGEKNERRGKGRPGSGATNHDVLNVRLRASGVK